MSRIRTVKPELFKHDELFDAEIKSQLPLRLAFIGLFTCCDREGRFKWRPRRLKIDILPYDDVDPEQIFNVLAEYGFITKYEHQGQFYGYIPSWHKHQHINYRESKSILPQPFDVAAETTTKEIFTENQPPIEDNQKVTAPITIEQLTTTQGPEIKFPNVIESIIETPKTVNLEPAGSRSSNDLQQIFNHWKIIMDHPEAKLDPKRQELINNALKLYNVTLICHAITGCSLTPYNMGNNERGERYDGLHIILKDAEQIERFIHNYNQPPQPAKSNLTKNNTQNIQLWLNKKIEEIRINKIRTEENRNASG